MVRPSIRNIQAVRGLRVGAENSAIGAVMLDALLAAAGLEVNDIQLVSIPVNEHINNYRSGKVDVVVTFEPVRTELLSQGAKVIFDSTRVPGRILDVLVVRADALDKHMQQITGLISAYFKALDYFAKQPEDAATRLGPYLKVRADQVLSQFDGLISLSLTENHVQFGGNSPKLLKLATSLRDLMLKRKLLHKSFELEHLVDPRCLPELQK
ncbi:hypothetical protein CCP3SC1AL1_2670002 [Gammaproteobacteria bacterium]